MMKEKAFEKVTEYIDAIAAKLGVASEHVYGLLVRQQLTEGIVYSILLPVVLVALIIVTMKIVKAYKVYDGYNDDIYIVGMLLAGIATIITVIINAIVIPDMVMKIFNPEYYAIKEIIEAVGGK